ncbi:MAG: hypothetical protein HQK57_10705 [Deltaproteobacteria bacterium]|nr:hypothetical protein [Deltaproteobacteria bacterium]
METAREEFVVPVDFPADIGKRLDRQYITEAVAAISYYNGMLSENEACEIIGVTRRQFEEQILPKFNLSLMGGTQEDIDFETEGL